jgi:hypothetical protein
MELRTIITDTDSMTAYTRETVSYSRQTVTVAGPRIVALPNFPKAN